MIQLKGTVLRPFRDLFVAISYQMAMILDLLKYSDIKSLDWEGWKIPFVVFFVMNKFFMLNMFMAVINETLTTVQSSTVLTKQNDELGDHFWYKLSTWVASFACNSSNKSPYEDLEMTVCATSKQQNIGLP